MFSEPDAGYNQVTFGSWDRDILPPLLDFKIDFTQVQLENIIPEFLKTVVFIMFFFFYHAYWFWTTVGLLLSFEINMLYSDNKVSQFIHFLLQGFALFLNGVMQNTWGKFSISQSLIIHKKPKYLTQLWDVSFELLFMLFFIITEKLGGGIAGQKNNNGNHVF